MSQKPLSILISGAGIGGSSLAMMLAKHPAFVSKPMVTLIERSLTPRATGQAIDIRGPGVRIIQHLGLEPQIKAKHTSETGIGFIGSQGEIIGQFDATGDVDNQSGTSEFEILRAELAQLLLDQIDEARNNIKVVYGATISSLTDMEDGVAVEFSSGQLESQKFDVVIAADGVRSKTRSLMFEQYKATDNIVKPMGMYIAFFTIPRAEHDNDLWNWYHAPNGLAIHIRPHRNQETVGVYLSITIPKRERNLAIEAILGPNDVAAQKKLMHDTFTGAGWQADRVLAAMDQSDDFYMQSIAQVVTPLWTQGRCALVGDAAYATMGMGTTLAMMGAYIIAGELSKVKTNDAKEVTAALKRHEEVFRPFVAKNTYMPPGAPQWANPQTKLGLGLLRSVIRFVSWTKINQLFTGVGEAKDDWALPDYGYGTPDKK